MQKVSIIIPAYNQGPFLTQAIETALGQLGVEVEVVVINDGSTDDTAKVAARFQDRPNFKYVEQPNAGLPGARNRGIEESSAPYLCFLDSDDFYHPEKVRKELELLEKDSGLGFVYCDVLVVDEAGNPLPHQWSVNAGNRSLSGNIFEALMLGGYFPPHTVMIRRSILEQVGPFDPELGGHADYELWLRVSGAGHRACYLDERLAYYRTHPDNMSKDWLRMSETRVASFRKIVKLYPQLFADSVHRLQQANRDLEDTNRFLQNQFEEIRREMLATVARMAATDGNPAPLWLHTFFRKTVPAKLRRSLFKRFTTLRRCFEEKQ